MSKMEYLERLGIRTKGKKKALQRLNAKLQKTKCVLNQKYIKIKGGIFYLFLLHIYIYIYITGTC